MIGTPGVNLHAPGPIGDTTPSTGAFSTLTAVSGKVQLSAWTFASSFGAITFVSTPTDVNYSLIGDGSGTYLNGASTLNLRINNGDIIAITSAGVQIAAGKTFAVGNNAVTGLVAGVLAALTTASIVIYDATGTAYRVPCITP